MVPGKLGWPGCFFGANDVGWQWCWLMELSLEASLKNQFPVVSEQLLAHSEAWKNGPHCCVIVLWMSINAAQGTALLRKMTRCVSRWGNLPTSHATPPPKKKKISLGLRCLKECPNIHPRDVTRRDCLISGVIWGAWWKVSWINAPH